MKNLKILFLLLFLTNLLSAQKTKVSLEKVDAYKKIYLTDKLNLNSENESKFWIAYNDYQDNLRIVYRAKRLKYRKMNLDSSNLSETEYKQFIDDFLDYEKKKIDLRAKLIVDLKEFMTLKKTVSLFRIEDDFRKEMMKKLRSKNKK
ncbi:MAG: hypothetical protein P8P25_00595 [Flavobacteriaceae bacterium]|nr:hypothetical protein [Flavobacteriaceae bacterium]MBT4298275.1 hypothetical protein [Flavobacteriaceae bacterium]MBT4960079.1 hypothetical protein [Flavobacteriaceae bacterium]MBT5233346.1 hypothetical protein [Flavobacteriaceae bacterium]MBT6654287.1 hypothetical protein [Flavobacteriaceae bacterium]